jgi:D-3-phosphoglycerate dehydrogenase
MKILVCDKISSKGVEKLQKAGFTVDVKTGMDKDTLIKTVPGYHAVIVRSATKIVKEVIDASTDLKLVVRGGVGLDNVDKVAAKAKGVKVMNTPDASTESVAELVVGLFLAQCRKITQADASMKKGQWEKKAFEGIELYQKTLGVVGSGRIGRRVAMMAKAAFGMTVLAYDPYADKDQLAKEGIKACGLDELLAASDFITLHLPKTDETKGLFNDEAFAKMKKGVVIVNCARGGVVDEAALLKALEAGTVASAALDVFSQEPLPADSPLLKAANLILTPHLGASSVEGQARVSDEVAEIIIKELKA